AGGPAVPRVPPPLPADAGDARLLLQQPLLPPLLPRCRAPVPPGTRPPGPGRGVRRGDGASAAPQRGRAAPGPRPSLRTGDRPATDPAGASAARVVSSIPEPLNLAGPLPPPHPAHPARPAYLLTTPLSSCPPSVMTR